MPARGLNCAGTNCSTRAIRHDCPDKLRLSLNSNFHSRRERHPVFGGPLRNTDSGDRWMWNDRLHSLYDGKMTYENAASADISQCRHRSVRSAGFCESCTRKPLQSRLGSLGEPRLSKFRGCTLSPRPNIKKPQELHREIPKAISPSS